MRDPQDRQRFAEGIGGMLELFDPERAGQPDRRALLLKVYWQTLGDLSIEEFERAVSRALTESKWMPKPAELRQLAGEVTLDSRIAQSWEVLTATMRRVGAYGSVDFGDPVLHATVRAMGGWQSLCRRESEWLNTFGKSDFAKTYRAMWDAPIQADQAAHLEGQHEIEAQSWPAEWQLRSPLAVVQVPTGLPASKRHVQQLEAAKSQRQTLQLVASTTEQAEALERVRGLIAGVGGEP